jgi:hypothetical protein
MHPCSSSSVSSCVASSGGGAVAAAAGAAAANAAKASGSSYITLPTGGAAATHAHPFSLRQRQSRPLAAFDCWGLALVWGVFGIGLVLVLLDGVASPRVEESVQPPPALRSVQQP